MVKIKTLIPNDLRDFISLIALFGFVAIFFKYFLDNSYLSNNLDSVFLILGGASLLVLGKVLDITKWARDGIQKNEVIQLLSVIFGLVSVVLGVMLFMNLGIPTTLRGVVGFLALFPALFIVIDYFSKNKRKG